MVQAVSDEVDQGVQNGDEQQEVQDTAQATGEQPEAGEGAEATSGEGAQDEEVVVTLGDSPTPEEEEESRAPEWVRELRKSNREKDRRLRELEQQLAAAKGTGQQPAAVEVGEKPTLEGCNYDAAEFETKLDAWKERKRQADEQQARAVESQRKQQEAWQATLQDYGKERSELKVRDYEEAEQVVEATLNVVQQGVILHGVEKGRRAVVVYALGKNPAKCKELAAIQDPVKFAFAVAKLESQLKVSPRKSAPPPERQVRSSVAGAAAVDNQLEKLRAEAAKTGDLTPVLRFKQQQQRGRG